MNEMPQPPITIAELIAKGDELAHDDSDHGARSMSRWYESESARRTAYREEWSSAPVTIDGIETPLIPGHWYDVTIRGSSRNVADKSLRNCLYQRRTVNGFGEGSEQLLFEQWGANPQWRARVQPRHRSAITGLRDLGTDDPAAVRKVKATL